MLSLFYSTSEIKVTKNVQLTLFKPDFFPNGSAGRGADGTANGKNSDDSQLLLIKGKLGQFKINWKTQKIKEKEESSYVSTYPHNPYLSENSEKEPILSFTSESYNNNNLQGNLIPSLKKEDNSLKGQDKKEEKLSMLWVYEKSSFKNNKFSQEQMDFFTPQVFIKKHFVFSVPQCAEKKKLTLPKKVEKK